MSDQNASTPKVFIVRHGETPWTISGRHTGLTDIPLTPAGIAQARRTSSLLVGPNRLIDPSLLAHVFVSPRQRAQVTLTSLLDRDGEAGARMGVVEEVGVGKGGWRARLEREGKVSVEEDVREWEYGDYEGLGKGEIVEGRRGRGVDGGEKRWDIWRDGCEGGESPEDITRRCDRLIEKIRDIQRPYIKDGGPGNVLVVAHGQILRAFTKRWLRFPIDFPLPMMMGPGAVGTLSYAHKNIEEPSLLIGMGVA